MPQSTMVELSEESKRSIDELEVFAPQNTVVCKISQENELSWYLICLQLWANLQPGLEQLSYVKAAIFVY